MGNGRATINLLDIIVASARMKAEPSTIDPNGRRLVAVQCGVWYAPRTSVRPLADCGNTDTVVRAASSIGRAADS